MTKDFSKTVSVSSAANDFIKYAQIMAATRGVREDMISLGAHVPSRRLQTILQKTGVDAGDSTSSQWATELNAIQNAFLDSLSNWSAVDRLISDQAVMRLPFRTRVIIASTGATGGQLSELAPQPLSSMEFGQAAFLEPVKLTAAAVYSEELARNMSTQAARAIGFELRKSVALASDTYFCDTIASTSDVASGSSSGMSASAFLGDVQEAMASIVTSPTSRLYLLLPAAGFNIASLLRDSGGFLVQNGSLGNVKLVPTAALSDSMILLDAQSVVLESEAIEILPTTEATIQLSDSPSSVGGSGSLLSLFQNGLVGIAAKRYIAAALVRSDAAAIVSSLSV